MTGAQLPSDLPAVCEGSGGHRVVLDCCAQALCDRDGYRRERPAESDAADLFRQVRNCNMLTMDTPWPLDLAAKLSDQTLAVMCGVTGLGKPVVARSDWYRCRADGPPHAAVVQYRAVNATEANLVITETLRRESPLFCTVLERIAALPRSKWNVVTDAAQQASATTLNSRDDVRSFLCRVRRVSHSGPGVLGGKYLPVRQA